MSEPIDETPAGTEPAPTEAGWAAIRPPAGALPEVGPADVEAPVGLAPEPPPTTWVTPPAGGASNRTKGCVILVVVAAIILVVGFFGLIFLGSQVEKILSGTIQFGTGGTGCAVTDQATTFPASRPFRAVAFLQRETRAGETLKVVVTYPNNRSETSDESFDAGTRCVIQDVDAGLDPGHYSLEYRSGSEVLAKGGFDITP